MNWLDKALQILGDKYRDPKEWREELDQMRIRAEKAESLIRWLRDGLEHIQEDSDGNYEQAIFLIKRIDEFKAASSKEAEDQLPNKHGEDT